MASKCSKVCVHHRKTPHIITLKPLREITVHTSLFQSTLNTKYKNIINTFDFLQHVEFNAFFNLLNNGGTEMVLLGCFILALVEIKFFMTKLHKSRNRLYSMVTSTGKLDSLLL